MKFEAVIGLEVHTQLSTNSKIFCSCSTSFGADANSQVCPVCLGMPGVLPVLNKEVVRRAIMAGLALNCEIREKSVFARKNYFYPDLPKGYQISQYELPICEHGYIDIELESGDAKRIGVTRIHMEEDAGKSIHGENIGSASHSYVDLNRTCVPLLEIVSEPDMRTGEEARAYLQKLKATLLYLGISDCNMEEGSLRCDANISIRPVGQEKFGTKAEIKNMNSFRNVARAIEYEIKRQEKVITEGGQVVQETRLWDAQKNVTYSMRSKEEAHDYRYFPDPDLVPLVVEKAWVDEVKSGLPELPDAKKARFVEEYALSAYNAEVLTSDKAYADFFEEAVTVHKNPKAIANLIMGDVLRVANEKACGITEVGVNAAQVAGIVKLIDAGTISTTIAKKVFEKVVETGMDPDKVVEKEGMAQVSDEGAIEAIVKEVLAAHPDEVERYRNGEKKLTGFFVGQVMKASRGKANPQMVNQLLNKLVK